MDEGYFTVSAAAAGGASSEQLHPPPRDEGYFTVTAAAKRLLARSPTIAWLKVWGGGLMSVANDAWGDRV